ncbi:CrpP-related protein [Aquincola sp. MAHUQ-54]|uniref:CrpP-related protein n=1 Tax=Aquincola agrisoli TaxID=3119538 RepID=A0AAW9Q7Z0_9BURK
MNRTVTPRPAGERSPSPEPSLSNAERSELERQGAKAAARGEPHDANPLSQPRNKPPATGESAERWSQRSEAWEHGHVVQSGARRKRGASRPPKGQR